MYESEHSTLVGQNILEIGLNTDCIYRRPQNHQCVQRTLRQRQETVVDWCSPPAASAVQSGLAVLGQ